MSRLQSMKRNTADTPRHAPLQANRREIGFDTYSICLNAAPGEVVQKMTQRWGNDDVIL